MIINKNIKIHYINKLFLFNNKFIRKIIGNRFKDLEYLLFMAINDLQITSDRI